MLVGGLSALERNAAFGQSPVEFPADQPIQQFRSEAGRFPAGGAATAKCAKPNGTDANWTSPVRTRARRRGGGEGSQCERSSRGPARRRGGGACPTARSSLAADQTGCDGGSRNRCGCSGCPVGEKSITAARVFTSHSSINHRSSQEMAPDKAYASTAAPTAIHRPFLISFSGIDGAGKDDADRLPFRVSEGSGPARFTA